MTDHADTIRRDHEFKGRGPRCLKCGDSRWTHEHGAVTDHAASGSQSHGGAEQSSASDTIRCALNLVIVSDRCNPLWKDAEAALDALDAYEAERQQAIDALREIARTETGFTYPQEIARAALVNLGEQP